jgi:hypothetical protein
MDVAGTVQHGMDHRHADHGGSPGRFRPLSATLASLLQASTGAGRSVNFETSRARCRTKLVVVRRKDEAIEVVPDQQGAREVDGVQRAQGRRKGLRGPLKNERIHRNETERVDRLSIQRW